MGRGWRGGTGGWYYWVVSGGEGEEGIKLMEAKGREVKDEWRGGEKGGREGSVRRI